MRFVEVSPGAPEMDFSVNGTGAAYGLGFESFTSYLPVISGVSSVRVNRSGHERALLTSEYNFAGNHQYTVVLHRGLANLRQDVFSDQTLPAPVGEISLRVLNFVAGTPSVTVHLAAEHNGAGNLLQTLNLDSGTASSYLELPAADSFRVTAVMPGSGVSLPLSTSVLRAKAGSVRTVVLAGTVESANRSRVVSFVLEDADPS